MTSRVNGSDPSQHPPPVLGPLIPTGGAEYGEHSLPPPAQNTDNIVILQFIPSPSPKINRLASIKTQLARGPPCGRVQAGQPAAVRYILHQAPFGKNVLRGCAEWAGGGRGRRGERARCHRAISPSLSLHGDLQLHAPLTGVAAPSSLPLRPLSHKNKAPHVQGRPLSPDRGEAA